MVVVVTSVVVVASVVVVGATVVVVGAWVVVVGATVVVVGATVVVVGATVVVGPAVVVVVGPAVVVVVGPAVVVVVVPPTVVVVAGAVVVVVAAAVVVVDATVVVVVAAAVVVVVPPLPVRITCAAGGGVIFAAVFGCERKPPDARISWVALPVAGGAGSRGPAGGVVPPVCAGPGVPPGPNPVRRQAVSADVVPVLVPGLPPNVSVVVPGAVDPMLVSLTYVTEVMPMFAWPPGAPFVVNTLPVFSVLSVKLIVDAMPRLSPFTMS
jgi:hypothetical protein